MRVTKAIFFSLLILSAGFNSVIGQQIKLDLEWSGSQSEVITETSRMKYPDLKDVFFNGKEFVLLHSWVRPSAQTEWKLELTNYNLAPASTFEKQFIQENNLRVTDVVEFSVKNVRSMNKPVVNISLNPFIKVNGEVNKIVSVTFQKTNVPVNQLKTGHEFAENSVLRNGSGEWYKISVRENGIHIIDYDFLQSMGVNLSGINPTHINIYGNGFGKLPENNSDYRPDDLIKNDIFIQGETDGSFDQGDFILFYGRGPHRWEESGSSGFSRVLNNYATYSAYYININPSEAPARIQPADLSSSAPSITVNDYNSYAVHELERINLLKGGQRWYGEEFDASLSQTFSFNIPNLNPSAGAIVKSFMACSEGSSSGNTNFNITYSGSPVGSTILPASASDSYSRSGFTSLPGDFSPAGSSFGLTVNFNRVSPSDIAYLDYIEVNARSFLTFHGSQFEFRDRSSVGIGNVSEFEITGVPSLVKVWEITDHTKPKLVNGTLANGIFNFTVETDSLRSFICFDGSVYKEPTFIEKVRYQNLHGLPQADYLIVTHPSFLAQANRLAGLHVNNGLSVHVVTTDQVYNEFSGGTQDPTAIKFFAKMFYDRAEGDPALMPKYLCLFGDGTYDPLGRVANNNYMVPVYHTQESEGYISTLLSDDYFGFLDDAESFSSLDDLDIAVGRLVATTSTHAVELVDKIEHYMKNGSSLYAQDNLSCGEDGYISTHGDWRLKYTMITDDEENGYFVVNDTEPAYDYVTQNHPEMNARKIYSDAYDQISTAGGERYPEVNEEIDRTIESGSLLMAYVGHGGAMGAASERIITIGQIQSWENIDRLTLFVSATCEFGRIDDNERVSAGELMALNPVGGAIALMTTTRAVYFTTNSVTTARFFENVFLRDSDMLPLTFGEIITQTKNAVSGGNNKRSFMLLGDPALRIALPYEKVVLDSVNNVDVNLANDTIRALSKVRMKGHVEDQFGNNLTTYNGILQPSVYDKPRQRSTLGQDNLSPVINFEEQVNVLYRGKVSITNGMFDYEFIVPKDINYNFGPGKASFYGYDNNDRTSGGYSKSFIIGGIDTAGLSDNIGPEIILYLNDENFANGGITDETPILIAELFDESGINTVGNGIGHDITVILDQNTSDAKVLNEFYEADLDTYKSGSLRYQLSKLEPGLHTLTFKAWDVNNNSSEKTIEFTVQESTDLALAHVLNYPNPFTTSTEFYFEHNQVCAALETQIEIYTVSGRLVKTINEMVETRGFRTEGIHWDGRDEFGDQLAKGVYVYRITVRNPDGLETRAMEKLYLLK
ncbi:MAG: type IX secretion system sortase PorU [Brumimicrobium sp.]|nr:type IX secretion system sortase PorU [Brumimicrobium sp.]